MRKARYNIISLVTILLLLAIPFPVSASIVQVPSNSISSYCIPNSLRADDKISWEWHVVETPPYQYFVDFWIMSDVGYGYNNRYDVPSDEGSFVIPHDGAWCLEWENRQNYDMSIDYSVEVTPSSAEPTEAPVNAPIWNIGDYWRYEIDNDLLGKGSEVWRITGERSSMPSSSSGLWVVQRTRKTTLEVITEYWIEKDTFTVVHEQIGTLPPSGGQIQLLKFPMETGNAYGSFLVIGCEEVNVPSGKFSAIKIIDPGTGIGFQGDDTTLYYSGEVGFFVKTVNWGVAEELELIEYKLKSKESNSNLLTIGATVIIGGIILVVAAIILIRRRKEREKAPSPQLDVREYQPREQIYPQPHYSHEQKQTSQPQHQLNYQQHLSDSKQYYSPQMIQQPQYISAICWRCRYSNLIAYEQNNFRCLNCGVENAKI